jgi:hypothetical protein
MLHIALVEPEIHRISGLTDELSGDVHSCRKYR